MKMRTKSITIIVILASLILTALLIFIGINKAGKADLKKNLLRDWEKIETTESGAYYSLVLDFSENEIDYNFESGYSYIDETISTYSYRVVSPDTIEVAHKGSNNYKKIKITFNDDKSMMIMTPGLIESGSEEDWFNYE